TAVEWYQKAAQQGNATAQQNLGELYENGLGVEKDLSQAQKYYQQACNSDKKIACKSLERINKKLEKSKS
ncbi:MAG: sel1 repeat family protein, partial [Neisseriaceae bacterium]|nr:sel1 repeat family protein [Neisseriaceae bacterium]